MLRLTDIRKSYTTFNFTQKALDGVSIAFRDNEFAAVLGPSGSGKTTMLNIIGGLDHYDSGDLEIDNVSTKNYKDRDWDSYRNNRVGFVFQNYNLIPHQSVLSNVELALTLSGVPKAERRERAKKALEDVGLGDHIQKKPNQLSGGQMQRVAIARALINDPDILLADEPTGALDTQTGNQVMDVLTEIARDRLVVMVTHNNELAEQYANRIIHLKDGKVISDSRPFNPSEEKENTAHTKSKKHRASMPFFTSLALLLSNLMTKKGRTFATAFAGSIGIIGIAVILALANGINAYIRNIEEETLSTYPLSIQSSGFDLSSMFEGSDGSPREEVVVDPGYVREMRVVESVFSTQSKNDLSALKSYFDDNEEEMDKYVNAIQYSYDITPQIYLSDTSNGAEQVSPDAILSAYGMGGASAMDSLGISVSGMNVFSEMPSEPSLYEGQYNVLAGNWPKNYDEAVLVISSNNRITDYELYAMGLLDRSELKTMLESFMEVSGIEVETHKDIGLYSYDELMNVAFKVVNPADRYQYDSTYDTWVDKSGDKAYMKSLVDGSTTLKIVGIVQPNPDSTSSILSSGINYTSGLIRYLMDEAAGKEIVIEQMSNPKINVLSGRSFSEEQEEATFDFSKIISVDEEVFRNAFSIDTSAFNMDTSSFEIDSSAFDIDPSLFAFDPSSVNINVADYIDFSKIMENISVNPGLIVDMNQMISDLATVVSISPAEITPIIRNVTSGFLNSAYADGKPLADYQAELDGYLQSQPVQDQIAAELAAVVDPTTVEAQVTQVLTNFIVSAVQNYMADIQAQIQNEIQLAMMQVMQLMMNELQKTMVAAASQLQAGIEDGMMSTAAQIEKSMKDAMSQLSAQVENVDPEALAAAFQVDMGEDQILELMNSIMNPEEKTYEQTLLGLGYVDADVPSQINIYPRSFEAKQQVIDILTQYNERMEENDESEMVIRYTDIVGVMMSSVTDIVDLVGYALTAFVAVSLVVSSIMIGVITFISVLERKKEIGILRAIGASKRNIRLVFNAETLIIGFVAGVLGVLVSVFISFIANIILFNLTGVETLVVLPPAVPVILVAISMFLTFVAGLFPASAAARKDPVEALRSE